MPGLSVRNLHGILNVRIILFPQRNTSARNIRLHSRNRDRYQQICFMPFLFRPA